MTIKQLKEEMFEDWLWDKMYDELYSKVVEEVEKEQGIWRSILGVKDKINERHDELFEKELKALLKKETKNG
jgi:hypothetical protein